MSHVTVSEVWGKREMVSNVTGYGVWRDKGQGTRCYMLWFLGLGGERGKVSHVTVSGVSMEKGKGVTCYG